MNFKLNHTITAWLTALCCMLLMLAPAPVHAEETEKKISDRILEHIGDSYEWHFTRVGDTEVAIPLPILVYSQLRHEWFCFSSHHVMEGDTYQGFWIPASGPNKGKLVEWDEAATDNEKSEVRPIDISLTKNVVALFINSALLIAIVLGCARWYKRHDYRDAAPKGFVGLLEMMVDMVYNDIIKANIPVHVQRYAGYLLCAFFFIFFNNLIGLIPGSANLTGNIAVTIVLGLCTFVMVNLFGNKEYWKEIFWADVPGWLKPIMAVIEFFGIFTKPLALIIRLFANIMAGHAALMALVCVIFITFGISTALGSIMTPLTLVFCIFLDFLEVLVAFIQAYVFTMLSAVFIGLSQPQHHAVHETK